MASNFSPETDNETTTWGERGASQRVLLLVLLLIVAAGGYLYFFTGLIKPREEVAKSAPAQPATVKMPIPPRSEQPAPSKEAAAVKPEEKKAGEAAQGKPALSPAPAPAQPAAQPAPSQPAPPKPAAVPVKPETVKAAKAAPSAKPAAPPITKAQSSVPAASATGPQKQATKTKPAAQKETRVAAKRGGYALQVGSFITESSVREALARLKKAGVAPVAKTVEKKSEPMNRLFVAEFSDHDEAAAELAKVKKTTADAFILRENSTYAVYAGSYFLAAKAAAEQDRLYDKGIKTLMKKSQVAVSVTKLTAGAFPSRTEAQQAAARLKKQGLTAMVVKTGK